MRLPSIVLSALLVVAVSAASVVARQASPAQLALEAARKVELIDRNLKSAVVRYRDVVSTYPKDRAVVPEALLGLASCLEQLGQPREARAVYERVVKDYPDTAPTKTAQKKLAAFAKKGSGLTIERIEGAAGAPSMNGGYLSFGDPDTGDLAVRDLESGRTRRVTDKGDFAANRAAPRSVPSPDGSRIAYMWVDTPFKTDLRVIGSRGGPVTVLCCPLDSSPEIFSDRFGGFFGWSMDGKQVLFTRTRGRTPRIETQLLAVAAIGGAPHVMKTVQGQVSRASWSPDGRFVIYDAPRAAAESQHALFIMSSDGSNSAVLLPQAFNDRMLDWFPDGKHVLFVSDRYGSTAVFAQSIVDGKAVGSAFLVKDNVENIEGLGFTRDGSYHYKAQTLLQDVLTFRLDASGVVSQEVARLPGRFGNREHAAWSPDGSQIAYEQAAGFDPGDRVSLSIRSIATGQVRTVSVDLGWLRNPSWTPDGLAMIAEGETHRGHQGLFRIDLGSGAVTPIGEPTQDMIGVRRNPIVSLNGEEVLYLVESKGIPNSIQARNLNSGFVRVVFEGSPMTFALSRDGRFIAVVQRGRRLQIVPVAGQDVAFELAPETGSGNLGLAIAWSPDGRYVWFNKSTGMFSAELWRTPIDGGPAQRMNALSTGMPSISRLSAAPDGTMAVSTQNATVDQWVMRNIPIRVGR